MAVLHVKLISAGGVLLDTQADALRLQAEDGSFGVLPGHAPALARLAAGPVRCRSGSEVTEVVIPGGVAEIRGNEVLILTDA